MLYDEEDEDREEEQQELDEEQLREIVEKMKLADGVVSGNDIVYGIVDKESIKQYAPFKLEIFGEEIPVVVVPRIVREDEDTEEDDENKPTLLAAYIPATKVIFLTPYAFADVSTLVNTLVHEALHAHGYLVGLPEFQEQGERIVQLVGSFVQYLLVHNRELFMLILNSFDDIVQRAMEKMEKLDDIG